MAASDALAWFTLAVAASLGIVGALGWYVLCKGVTASKFDPCDEWEAATMQGRAQHEALVRDLESGAP